MEQYTDSGGLTHTFHCLAVAAEDCSMCVEQMTYEYEGSSRVVHNTISHTYDEIQSCGSQYILEVIWSDA